MHGKIEDKIRWKNNILAFVVESLSFTNFEERGTLGDSAMSIVSLKRDWTLQLFASAHPSFKGQLDLA